MNDLGRLRIAAERADGVIHAAFHDFANIRQNSEDDRKVIETLGEVMAGSDRPLIITSGTGLARSKIGAPAVETDDHDALMTDLFARFAERIASAPRVHEPYMVVAVLSKL
ncbi:MAG: hypothetical protein JO208_15315 [Alphaproteobacteria bacterium]|nr:hypothetical protein [Alphaproteobacteria bacterium]